MAVILMVFGVLLVALGAVGWIKGGSLISLIMGGVFGVWIEIAGVGMRRGRKWARPLALAGLGLLAANFFWRYGVQGKPLSLALALMSSALLLWIISARGSRSP